MFPICLKANLEGHLRPLSLLEAVQRRGQSLGEDWQIDFTHMPPCKGYQYILVFVDTFTGWIEAYPTKTKKASEVPQAPLEEIIPVWPASFLGE